MDAAQPTPWHLRLQARLKAVEDAAAALQAVCEEPDAQDALEVRVVFAARASRLGAREAHVAPARPYAGS